MTAECSMCGAKITANESIERGMGTECWKAYQGATTKELYKIEGFSLEYNWLIKVRYYLEIFVMMYEKKRPKFRSEFKKDFYDSVTKKDARISKRQLEIIRNWVFEGEFRPNEEEGCEDDIYKKQREYRDEMIKKHNIKITRKDVEVFRKEIRDKNA